MPARHTRAAGRILRFGVRIWRWSHCLCIRSGCSAPPSLLTRPCCLLACSHPHLWIATCHTPPCPFFSRPYIRPASPTCFCRAWGLPGVCARSLPATLSSLSQSITPATAAFNPGPPCPARPAVLCHVISVARVLFPHPQHFACLRLSSRWFSPLVSVDFPGAGCYIFT